MGSIYAGLLAAAGNEVIAVDRSEDHVRAINTSGLRVSGASGDRVVRIEAHLEPPDTPVDLVVIAAKASDVGAAATGALAMISADTVVVTIQNGLGSADEVASIVGASRLAVGVAQGFGASRPAPGHTHHDDMKAIRIGAYGDLDGTVLDEVVEIWASAGFDVATVADVVAMQWEKLICNVAYSGPCTVAGLTLGQVASHAAVGAISRAAAVEAWQVARALGVGIAVDDPVALVSEFAARMPNAKPSVLLDVEAGRPSEIGVINGAIPKQAARAGLEAPVNAALTELVLAIEASRAPEL